VRVGVNLLWLVPGDVGGSETWVAGLLGHLAAHPPPGVDVVAFAPASVLAAHPWLDAFDVVRAPDAIGPSRPMRVAAESTWLAAAARRAGVDVLHHPGGTVPLLRATPAVVTIHDLQPLHDPEVFRPLKRAYLRARLGPSARRARLVTAVSDFTRDDVVTRLAVPADRVAVTPPAVDPDPAPATDPDDAALRTALRLDRPWFVYPAITYAHKDHATVVRALAGVPDVVLVLTGGAGPEEQSVRALAERIGVADRIRRPGRVPDGVLDRLYRGAVACVFPSRFEAVGLPVLEAMARGCPVLAAEATGLPAVVGRAGELVAPGDIEAWTAAMGALLHDAGRRAELAAIGRERVRAWEPAASAARLVSAWESAGARR
jgi:glycosyltransferase involved in cell wall biosynthesis